MATLSSIVAAFLVPSSQWPLVNAALNVCLPAHTLLGFQSIVTDYVPAYKFPVANRVATFAMWFTSVTTAYGLYLLNTRDVGMIEALRRVWFAQGYTPSVNLLSESVRKYYGPDGRRIRLTKLVSEDKAKNRDNSITKTEQKNPDSKPNEYYFEDKYGQDTFSDGHYSRDPFDKFNKDDIYVSKSVKDDV